MGNILNKISTNFGKKLPHQSKNGQKTKAKTSTNQQTIVAIVDHITLIIFLSCWIAPLLAKG